MLMMVWGGLEPNHPIIVPDNSDPGIAQHSTVLLNTLLYYNLLYCTISKCYKLCYLKIFVTLKCSKWLMLPNNEINTVLKG